MTIGHMLRKEKARPLAELRSNHLPKEQFHIWIIPLLCGCLFFFVGICGLSAFTKFFLLSGVAALIALGAADDINDDTAVVLAALYACLM